MKTRGRKTENTENQQDVCSTKTVRRNTSRKVNLESLSHEVSPSVEKRAALRERTNLSTSVLSTGNTSLKERCKGNTRKSENGTPKQLLVTPKERTRQREAAKVSSKTPSPKENSFRREVREKGISKLGSTPKDSFVSPKVRGRRASVSANNSTLTNSSLKRRCVYMSTIPEDKDVKDKEELYEFVADKNEPPSKRRRKRTVKKSRKPLGFPRRRNNSETSCSSASSHFTSFASSTGSSILKPAKNGAANKKNQGVSFCTSISSTCSSTAGIKPPATGGVKQQLVPILDSSNNPAASFSSIPSSTPVVATPTRKAITVPVNRSINHSSIDVPKVEGSELSRVADHTLAIIPPPSTSQNPNPPETPAKNSFGNSSIWSEMPSMSLGVANLHSTPCKARSGSDTSSCQQLDETNCNMENCFGFSSDEEEAEVNMISPLRLSPHSHAHRHTLLSPPKAPSRYSPQTVKKLLALREDSNLLNVNSSSSNNHKRKLQFQEGKKGEPAKKVGRRPAKKAVADKENIVAAFKAVQEKMNEASSDQQLGTPSQSAEGNQKKSLSPIAEGLFEDLETKEAEALTVRPPRRSYERPLKKNLKVAGGGLCLISDDEDDPLVDVEKKEEEVVEKKKKPQTHHPRRKATVAQKMEKELDHWASLMNMQFGEVEGFDLCIDKKFE